MEKQQLLFHEDFVVLSVLTSSDKLIAEKDYYFLDVRYKIDHIDVTYRIKVSELKDVHINDKEQFSLKFEEDNQVFIKFRLYKEDFKSDEKGKTTAKIYYKTDEFSVSCKLVEQNLGYIFTKIQSVKRKVEEGKKNKERKRKYPKAQKNERRKKKYPKGKWVIDHPYQGGAFSPR